MLVDLVQTTTRDGVRLHGALQLPDNSARQIGVDAFCLVHGTGSNFYSSSLLDSLAERLLGLGAAVLRVNTRGHDGISTAVTASGGRRIGAAYEVVDDCRHDLAAWVEWLRGHVGPRIALAGHSSGAVKCIYALAHEPQLGATAIVAISPPRLSYSFFCASPEGPAFLETYRRADRHVEAGQPATLLEVQLPLPLLITAAGYLEKYGPDERYDYLPLLARLPCPILITLGSHEVDKNMAFRGVPAALAEVSSRYGPVASEVIAGADHFYAEGRKELAERIASWLRATCN